MLEPGPRPTPQEVASRLAALEIFRSVDPAIFGAIAAGVEWVRCDSGAVLFRQGEQGDSMYVLVEGRLQVVVDQPGHTPDVVAELGPGTTVGEMALLTGQPRSATVTALVDSELARLERAEFDRLAEQFPEVMRRFALAMLPRFQQNVLVGAITAVFGGLTPEMLSHLQTELEWLHLRSGESLFRQGDPSDALYIPVNGRLAVTVADADGTVAAIGEVSRGECIGEAGLLTGEPRSASAHAVRDTNLVRLSRASFEHLIERHPQAMIEIVRIIARRAIPGSSSRPGARGRPAIEGRTVAAFALVAAGSSVPLDEFAQLFVRALEQFGPALYLSSERLDSLMGKAGIAQTAEDHPSNLMLVSWLSEQETSYRYIVYQTDDAWTEWTARCLRQSDRTLIVARAEADPRLGRVETALQGTPAAEHMELVLVQPAERAYPIGTRAWLAPRNVIAHHHVHLHDTEHMARLARRLTGRAMGLVLGGGGARGLAHIGAIRALEEAGIQIDLVGGTSIGGFVGAAYSMGLDIPAMVSLARRFGSREQFADYTVPLVAFFSSRKITTVLQAMFGDVYIEDLWRPYFCISSNLTQARPMIHREGLLWKYVRATTALPTIFTPIADEGDLLVDGGVMNNLPIDVMRVLAEGGPVIAVNVSLERDAGSNYTFGTHVSGWQVLGSRIRRRPLNVPSLFNSLMRTIELNEVYARKEKRGTADLLIAPSLGSFSLLEFESWQRIIDTGYRAAWDALDGWEDRPGQNEQ